MGGTKVKDGSRADGGPKAWKLAVKPADNRALLALCRLVQAERPGESVSAAGVIRGSVHEALARREGGSDV